MNGLQILAIILVFIMLALFIVFNVYMMTDSLDDFIENLPDHFISLMKKIGNFFKKIYHWTQSSSRNSLLYLIWDLEVANINIRGIYRSRNGKRIYLTTLKEIDGFKIGDCLRLVNNRDSYKDYVQEAKRIQIVGFESKQKAIRQFNRN